MAPSISGVLEMRKIDPTEFAPSCAWDALDIASIEGATVRLHWTDASYVWHVNDGEEVFVPLDGPIDMHIDDGTAERVLRLGPGQIFHAQAGDRHRAVPAGAVRVLVIEKAGSR
jgi:mannose-6-phosphate isomerase-like protein (cupin superfamily)